MVRVWRISFMVRVMMRGMMHGLTLSILFFLLVPAGFSKSPAGNPDRDAGNTDGNVPSNVTDPATTAPTVAPPADAGTPAEISVDSPAVPAQSATPEKKDKKDEEYRPAPIFT